jgi:1-acyl-sn-glycerol-3-phosphate acyltransferase
VIVASHSSHADTAALLAALPARRRPAVAAAADYWFDSPWRRRVCQAACGAFPVRRSGGASADLTAAAALLAEGRPGWRLLPVSRWCRRASRGPATSSRPVGA